MKHLEVRQKYSAARRIFNSLLSVSSGDETLRLMLDILIEKWFSLLFLIAQNSKGDDDLQTPEAMWGAFRYYTFRKNPFVALLTSSRGMTAPQLFGQFRGFLLHLRSWNYWDEMKWNEINHLSSNWSFKQSTIFQTVIIERGYETHTQDALLLSLLSTNLHIFMHQLRERLSVVKEMWGCRSWLNAHSLKVSAPMLSEARRVLTPSLKKFFFFASFYGPHPWQEDFLSTSWEVSTYFAR